jgi:hypothetical protein
MSKNPPHRYAGLEVSKTECPGCGKIIPVKINVNGCAYYYCANPLETDERGKVTRRCKTRFSMNQEASQRMIDQFLEQKGKEDVQDTDDERQRPGIGHNGGPSLEEHGSEDVQEHQEQLDDRTGAGTESENGSRQSGSLKNAALSFLTGR